MSHPPNFLRSLILASIFSFLAPIVVLVLLLMILVIVGYLPGLEVLSQLAIEAIVNFLRVFGSGSSLRGVTVISSVCCFVGALFDTYTFYRYHKLRGD